VGLALDRFINVLDRLINRERCRNYSIIFIVLGYGLIIVPALLGHLPQTAFGATVLPDYLAHWTGGRLVLDGVVDPAADSAALARSQAVGFELALASFVGDGPDQVPCS